MSPNILSSTQISVKAKPGEHDGIGASGRDEVSGWEETISRSCSRVRLSLTSKGRCWLAAVAAPMQQSDSAGLTPPTPPIFLCWLHYSQWVEADPPPWHWEAAHSNPPPTPSVLQWHKTDPDGIWPHPSMQGNTAGTKKQNQMFFRFSHTRSQILSPQHRSDSSRYVHVFIIAVRDNHG